MRYFGFQLKELLKRRRFKITSLVAAAIYGIAFIIARQSFLSDQEYNGKIDYN